MVSGPKISVIIPVYNGEDYLCECLDSVIHQTLQDIEIFIVNDGSTDSTEEILKTYSALDQRICVINQENAGAGAARNNALKYAKGEYLSILDADDVFELDMLEKSYNTAQKNNLDIVVFACDIFDDACNVQPADHTIRKDLMPDFQPFCSKDIKKDVFRVFIGWTWDKLFKREFVESHELKFQEQRTTNDALFTFDAIILAKKIMTLNEILVHHRDNKKSLSNTREKSWWCFYNALIAMKEDLIKFEVYDKFKDDYINYAINFTLWNLDTLAEPSKSQLMDKLKKEWLQNLGIKEYPIVKAYNKYEYYRLKKLWDDKEFELSIIVPVFNSEKYLEQFISCIKNQMSENLEIIFVDGTSSDNTLNTIAVNCPEAKSIVCPWPNYAHQVKMGLECANGKYFSIISPNMKWNVRLDCLLKECIDENWDVLLTEFSAFDCTDTHFCEFANYPIDLTAIDRVDQVTEFSLNGVSEYLLQICKKELFDNNELELNEQCLPQQAYNKLIVSALKSNRNIEVSSQDMTSVYIDFDSIINRDSYSLLGESSNSYRTVISMMKSDILEQPKLFREVINQDEIKLNTLKDQCNNLKRENEALRQQLIAVANSSSFKIGRCITYIPRKILGRKS